MEEGFLSVGGSWSVPQINFTFHICGGVVGNLAGEEKCEILIFFTIPKSHICP